MRSRLLGLMVGAAAVIMSAPAAAQSTGTITGKVTDRQTLQPLQNVQVRIVGTTRGALTDDAGNYRLAAVPAGTVQLAVQRIGFGPMSRTVSLASGGTTTA